MSRREELLQKCGLNNVVETSHCFNDTTHITCCELGEEARKYSDSTGNPIGKLSERVANKKDGVVPWCTCAGSGVCSFLSKKFNDGTKVKFIYNPKTDEIVYNPDEKAEFRKTDFATHSTPGITVENFNFVDNVKSENKVNFDFFKSKWFWLVAIVLLALFVISLIKNLIYLAIIIGVVILFFTIKKAIASFT